MRHPGLAIALVGTLLVGALPILPSEAAEAPVELPWWGPSDLAEAWTLRIPLVVQNEGDVPLTNAPVIADLDVGALARAAGWPASSTGGRTFLKSFTLEPTSIRVVEYTNFRLPRVAASDAQMIVSDPSLEGDGRFVVPSLVRPGFLEAEQARPYDPSDNPVLSVTWVADGTIEPGGSRAFAVYLALEESGPRPIQDQQRVDERLGGLYWIGRGTRVFGSGQEVTVTGLVDHTRVVVYVYDGHRPVAYAPPPGAGENPFDLNARRSATLTLGTSARPFLVVADKPVVATGQRPVSDTVQAFRDIGFIPSADGTLRGQYFVAAVSPGLYYMHSTTSVGASGTLNGDRFTPGGPVKRLQVTSNLIELETSEPVLLQGRPDLYRYPFVDLDTGAPVGDELVGAAWGSWWSDDANRGSGGRVHEPGSVLFHSLDGNAEVQGLTAGRSQTRLIPSTGPGSSGSTLGIGPTTWAEVQQRETWGFEPMLVRAVDPANPANLRSASKVQAIGGPPIKAADQSPTYVAAPLGGIQAQTFSLVAPVHVFAFHDGTRVQASWPNGTVRSTLLNAEERWTAVGDFQQPGRLVADKPVAVVPQNAVAYGAGLMTGGLVEPRGLHYVGHLVSLRPAQDEEEPMVRTASFGDTVTFALEARNLGRGLDGESLADTVRFELPPVPPGWNVTLDPSEVALAAGDAASVTLTVRTPETRNLGDRLRLSVAAVSDGNPRMRSTVETVTLLSERRDVGLWFETEDGPQELLYRFNPGETRDVPLVVKNLGSAMDEVRLAISGLQVGWNAALSLNETTIATTLLPAGEATTLTLAVTAPPAGGVILPTSFTVTGTSLNDTRAASKVLFDGLVLAKSRLRLDVEDELVRVEPGQTARFGLLLANEGNASADVQLNVSGTLPEGWPQPAIVFQGHSLAPVGNRITNLPPTGPEPLALDLELAVPSDARGRLHAKLLVTASPEGGTGDRPVTLPLNVFVEPRVHLDVLAPPVTTIAPDTTALVNFTLRNLGNVNATLPVTAPTVDPSWTIAHPRSVSVSQGTNATLPVTLGVPPGTAPLNTTLELQLTLPNGTLVPLAATVEVPRWRALSLAGTDHLRIVPGVPTNITVALRSVGNEDVHVALRAEAPPRWQVASSASPATLTPLHAGTARITVRPPADSPETRLEVRLIPDTDAPGGPSAQTGATVLRLDVVRPDLSLQDLSVRAGSGDGAPHVLRGTLVNRGTVAVENATVGLIDGSRIVSIVVISRALPDNPRLFALEVPDDLLAKGQLVVRADPTDRIPEVDETNNELTVAIDGDGANVPAPLGLVAVLVASLLGARWRRTRPTP